MSKFIPGLKLSELFFDEAVKPLIRSGFPGLKYSAGLLDYGSEVLGYDSERSTDHHWGPRVLIFLSPENIPKKHLISSFLGENLPAVFRGYSTNFGPPDNEGVRLLTPAKAKQPIDHRIEILAVGSFFKDYLGINIKANLTAQNWLTIPEQKLRTIRSGKIFYDKLGLDVIRKRLHYYPKDVWLYLLASEWMKISQEEPFVGRCSETGDELGSKLIASRLVHTIMRLCFLMEKEYTPYSKWFGTAFVQLNCARTISPVLDKILSAGNWKEREKHLSRAYKKIAEMHNDLKITRPLPADVSAFHSRPYLVIHGENFAGEIRKKIKDPTVKILPAAIGSVNQFTNTVDLLDNNELLNKMKVLYR